MVLAMKIISVAFDVDSNAINHMPDMWEYAGYALHAGSVVFGPWLSFHDYNHTLNYKDRKMVSYSAVKNSVILVSREIADLQT